jgi:hypothetical protein
VPPTHLTDLQIAQFHARRLPAVDVVVCTDHIAECADCRRRLAAAGDVGAAAAALALALDDEVDHLSESEVQAYVDRTLGAVRRGEVERHLDVCPECAEEIRDLRVFVAGSVPSRRPHWPVYAGLVAAAALVLAVAIGSFVRPQDSARPLVALDDQSGPLRIDERGAVSGLEGLTDMQKQTIGRALTAARLPLSSMVSELAGARGTLLGDSDAVAFRVLAPIGTAVLDDRPTLRWTPLAGSSTYTVTVQDQTTGAASSSPPLHANEWTVAPALTRGHRYTWQVAAAAGRTETVTPRPPDPPAQFAVLDAATALSLGRLPASHLARGILYAQAGVLDDAERELETLSARNPGSPAADELLKQLRAARSAR